MVEEFALADLIYSVAQAVMIFGPSADSTHECSSFDIAEHINPQRVSRRQPTVVYESDLEAGFSYR